MATLEKIRSKSVLLLIIIAGALLAFILGDFLTSGRNLFGPGTTIAKVDGTKIDVQEFQRRLEQATQEAQRQGRQIDGAVLQQQVLQSMIGETLLNQELDALGIVVTDNELSEAMLGQNSAMLDQMVQQQTGIGSAADLYDMAHNPSKYQLDQEQANQLLTYWNNLERQTEEMLRQQKFQTLFMGTLVANDLDARAIYDDNATTSHVAFARADYSTLPDDKFPVSDEELAEAYKARRNRYKIDEPMRYVDYVAVDIVPSAADLKAVEGKVTNALAAMATPQGVGALGDMPEFLTETRTYARRDLTPALKSFVDSAAVGKVAIASRTGYEFLLAKLIGTNSATDSINIDFAVVTRAEADSLIGKLNSGSATFASLPSEQKQDSAWVSLIDPQMATLKEMLETAAVGQFFTPDTIGEQARIFRVRSRKAPVTTYEIATASITAEPSAATYNGLMADLEKFLKANPTAESFAKNAPGAGYNLQNAMIGASTPGLGQLDETHDAVAWALEAKKGEVSAPFGEQTSKRLVAVAVEDIYDDGFVTVTNPLVRDELTTRVRNDKKAASLISQYKGKARDIPGYAQLMKTQVDTAAVVFGQIFVPGIGANESAFQASVATAKPGQLVGPMQTNQAVIVFTVNNVDKQGRPFDANEASMQFMQMRGANALARNLMGVLRGNKKIENNIPVFYK